MNDEKCSVYILQGPVVCIETEDNPPKRIYLSQVRSEEEERESRAERAANILSCFISAGTSLVMVGLVAHMIGIF